MGIRTRCLVHGVFVDAVRGELDVEFGEEAHAEGVDGFVCHFFLSFLWRAGGMDGWVGGKKSLVLLLLLWFGKCGCGCGKGERRGLKGYRHMYIG